MENYFCEITIDNETSYHLKFLKADLPWGVWKHDPTPDITPEGVKLAFVATGRPNLPGGVEGTVWYQLGDDANKTVKISFSVPVTPGTTNTLVAEPSIKKLGATLSPYDNTGNHVTSTITVTGA